ncbi:MAG: NADH-quinone oxidoreductase subunit L [Bryobacterales bacterium]|nr:NADH-quinone oxidoreductase subunit L [Bryobacterales bacterium]
MNFLELIWLIPLFPLGGAALMLLIGKRLDPQAPYGHDSSHGGGHHHHHPPATRALIGLLCPGMVLASFILSLGAVIQLASQHERVHQVIQFTWIAGLPFHLSNGTIGRFAADWGFLLDPISSVMILVVTGIGFLIHVYSVGYMAHDGGFYRFFGYLNLFVFFMLVLVLANNYALLFVGWEGVGLCSYLLIGFYFHKKSAGDAGKKAFLVNRIGDAGFILAMLLLMSTVGTLRFVDVNAALKGMPVETAGFGVLSMTALLLFVGATGKSAQFPLYVWLPDAMEGPTPVSALIHAATMVTAGVYMVARSSALFVLTPSTSAIVMTIGAFTAILAATIALTQNDIKRVLAYSTVSQLGFMFMAAGAGAYWVAVFHLYTHAFFKALLFLGSGSVIHAMSGEQDMRHMGGLKNKIPITHWTMFIGSLAIAGVPGLAGFFSKDEILWEVWQAPLGSHAVYVVGITTALMTAFYMWRLMYLTFYGEPRMSEEVAHHVHESPKTMTVPLIMLALGSIAAGWIHKPFEHWLELPMAEGHGDHTTEYLLMGLSIAIAFGGIFLASRFYKAKVGGPLYTTLLNKWYVDEIYDFLFVRGLVLGGGKLLFGIDRRVVDGGVNGAGWLTRFTSTISMWWDTWIIDGLVRLSAFAVKVASFPVRVVQSGYVQSYALIFTGGVALAFLYYLTQ